MTPVMLLLMLMMMIILIIMVILSAMMNVTKVTLIAENNVKDN